MDKVKNYTIILLFLVIGFLLLLRQCNSGSGINIPKEDKSILKRTETIKFDTIHSTHDSIVFKTKYYPQWIKSELIDTIVPKYLTNVIRTYNDSLTDSNLTIYSKDRILGMLQESQLSYRLKIPQYIVERHEIHDTKMIPNKWSIGVNGIIGGNKATFNMYIGGDIRFKKVIYGYNYGVLDHTQNIKIGYIIFNSKN